MINKTLGFDDVFALLVGSSLVTVLYGKNLEELFELPNANLKDGQSNVIKEKVKIR